MSTSDSDDDLRALFHELREEEAAHAPAFEDIRRAPAENAGVQFWRQPAWAMAAAVVLALGAGWWATLHRDDARPSLPSESLTIETATEDFPSDDEWTTATDSLLADADGVAVAPSVERLTREIAALLQP